MTPDDENIKAIETLVKNFLLDEPVADAEVTKAFERMANDGQFDLLGKAVYMILAHAHLAKLAGAKAVLRAQRPRKGLH